MQLQELSQEEQRKISAIFSELLLKAEKDGMTVKFSESTTAIEWYTESGVFLRRRSIADYIALFRRE